MVGFSGFGKGLILLGLILIIIGIFFLFGEKIPFLGKLPGDIVIRRDKFTFYFPLATSILISLILTLVFRLFRK